MDLLGRLDFYGARLIAVIGAFLLLLQIPPWFPAFPTDDLTAAWGEVLALAYKQHWHWGKDIILTFGPLGFLFQRLYDPEIYPQMVGLLLVIGGSVGLGLWVCSRQSGFIAAAVAAAGFLIGVTSPDVVPFCVPLLLVVVWSNPASRLQTAAVFFLVLSSAIVTLDKLSMFPLCLLSVLLPDLVGIVRRKLPILTLGYLIFTLALWLWAGQKISDIPAFVSSVAEVIGGYEAAMQIFGPPSEVLEYLGTVALIAVILGWPMLRVYRSPDRLTMLAVLITLAAFIFLTFKAGFVRHDGHSLIAWQALCAGTSLFLLVPRHWLQPWSLRMAAVVFPVLPAMLLAITLEKSAMIPWQTAFAPFEPAIIRAGWSAFIGVMDGTSGPTFDAARARTLAEIAKSSGLPTFRQSTDMVPFLQTELIATGANYRPRPIFQSYAAYTGKLAAANRDFFESDRAPEQVLFGLERIDNRYPSMDDGLTWIPFLERYAPSGVVGNYLLLKQRERADAVSIGAAQSRDIPLNEAVPLWTSTAARAVWAKIEIRQTFLGRMLDVLWKEPTITLMVDVGGQSAEFKLVRSSAEAGFLLSPLILSYVDFAQLYAGDQTPAMPPRQVSSIRLNIRGWARRFFQPQATVSLAEMTLPAGSNALLSELTARNNVWWRLAATSQTALIEDDDLFAHAPSEMSLQNDGKTSIDFGFGIKDGAWQSGGQIHGVVFRLSYETAPGHRQELWSRTLRPLTVTMDRGLQHASVQLPREAGRLIFETLPLDGVADWAWSYWGQMALVD